MKPRVKPQDSGTEELFRSKLKNIINLRHELVRLGELIDWARLEAHFTPYYKEAGRPGLPIRLVVGLQLLKHIEGLSDEAVCERWERDPYMQYFCGEEYFQHAFPLERSGMTHFRNRVGDEALETLLQETLAAAHRGGSVERARDRSGGGGHHGAGKSDCASHRTRVAVGGHPAGGRASEKGRAEFEAVVRARGAARGDENGALPARQTKEACSAAVEIYARATQGFAARRAAQDGTGSCFIGAHGETAGERAGPRLAHRASEAR